MASTVRVSNHFLTIGLLCISFGWPQYEAIGEQSITAETLAYHPLGEQTVGNVPIDEHPDGEMIDLIPEIPDVYKPTGVTRSRWAMDDPEYAVKYANGASKRDVAGKIKQASDARFIDDFSGGYCSAGITDFDKAASPLASFEMGYTGYWESYLTNRIGFIAAVNDSDYFLGGETGLRLQTPTRFAPFVGLGLFAGVSNISELATDDNIDNNEDGFVDEIGEQRTGFDGALAAIYPETGIHFWWSPRIRFSGFGRYLITTQGRDADSWYYGFSMAVLSR